MSATFSRDLGLQMIRIHKLTIIIDVIGVFCVALAIIAFAYPQLLKPSWQSFLQNFSVEMIGTWISVRLIDLFVSEREKANAVRIRVLRSSRFWLNQLAVFNGYVNYQDILRLQREYEYSASVSGLRGKYLNKSEKDLYDIFNTMLASALDHAKDILDQQEAFRTDCDVFRSELSALDDYSSPLHLNNIPKIRRAIDTLEITLCRKIMVADRTSQLNDVVTKLCDLIAQQSAELGDGLDASRIVGNAPHLLNTREAYVRRFDELQNNFRFLEIDIREETPED
ncbi:hypothetical protein [Mesorhizobium sp. M0579]|uniref:hypothetical protein n=1 Tax=Mesorhizobium sp. M0579 TaxID=2956962 RepID=UPI00333934E7